MAESRIVQHAERSPSVCVACGTHEGPFADFDLTTFPVATASGLVPLVDGSVYLCVGTAERPGCVIQAARKSGLVVDAIDYEQLALRVDELKGELAEARSIAKKKTISLEDAERLLAPAGDF